MGSLIGEAGRLAARLILWRTLALAVVGTAAVVSGLSTYPLLNVRVP